MKKTLAIAASAALSLTLVGCGANDDTAMNNNNNNNNQGQGFSTEQVRTRNVNNNNNANNNNQNNGRNLSVSDRAEIQVEKMKEVEEANVIIWNNNAYVAVRLANNNGNNQAGGNAANVNNRNNNADMGDRPLDNGRALLNNGVVNQSDNRKGNNGIIDGQGDAGRRTQENAGTANTGNHNLLGVDNNNNERSGATPDHVTTDYASDWNNYSPVSNAFEQRIADRVRQVEKKIHNVYVSNNPALYGKMKNYADELRTNGNREGILDDFNNTVNNFFGRDNG